MMQEQVENMLLQALEHEMGGVKIYAKAISCAVNESLANEWKRYQSETKEHVRTLQKACAAIGVDPEKQTPGRNVVRHVAQSLVDAMTMAQATDTREAAELVACDCIVFAETKDHANWQLIGKCAQHTKGPMRDALKAAYDSVENQEDEHLYHTRGWCRELWLASFGLAAVLPPPEERLNTRTMIGAARAEQSADKHR